MSRGGLASARTKGAAGRGSGCGVASVARGSGVEAFFTVLEACGSGAEVTWQQDMSVRASSRAAGCSSAIPAQCSLGWQSPGSPASMAQAESGAGAIAPRAIASSNAILRTRIRPNLSTFRANRQR